MTVQYYDKPFPLIAVVDLSNLNKQDQESVSAYLKSKYNSWQIVYPSEYAKESAEQLGKKGFLKFKEKPPYTLTTDESLMLFMRSLDKFNPHAVLRTTPNTLRVLKSVQAEKDLVRVVDDLTLQQDNITLSNIWQLANREHRITYTLRAHPVNERICRCVISMADEYIGKRKFEEKMNELTQQIDSAIETDKIHTRTNYNEGKYRQY